MTNDKSKALEMAIHQIERQFGKGAIMRLGENSARLSVEVISSGCLQLDVALGVGGFPRGRIIELFGPESGGKTTIALQAIAEAQKNGGNAAFIDVEHALDPMYSKNLGVDIDNLLISQPDTAEQALEIVEALIRSNAIDMIVLDSVAALSPKAEIEGEMGDAHMGLQARLMSQALRKLTAIISKSKACAIFINQVREKIGVMFGNPETTPGGRALKFYSSIRLDVRKADVIKTGSDVVGIKVKIKVVKNKVAPPFKQTEVDIIYGKGVSQIASVLDLSAELGVINKSGTWYTFGDLKLGQGRENAKLYLEANPKIALEIETKVRCHPTLNLSLSNSSLETATTGPNGRRGKETDLVEV